MDDSLFKQPTTPLTRLPTPVPSGEAEFDGRKPADDNAVQERKGAKPIEVVVRTARAAEEDSESSGSVSSLRSRRLWRRHSRSIDSLTLNTSDTDEPAPKALTVDGRGRGRPPFAGKYVGLKKAQKERDRLKREEARQKTEEEIEERLRFVKSPMPPKDNSDEDRPVLMEDLKECGQIVRGIIRKSGNRKGTSQKALNRVINIITRYVEQPESAAIARLKVERQKAQEDSARLEASVKRLQEENASLRRRLENLEASNKNITTTEEMLAMVEARVQAQLESALMGPAQRPPLAHERRVTTGDTQLPVSGGIVGGPPPPKPQREKEKGKRKKTAQPVPPIPDAVAGPSSAPPQAVAGPSTAPTATAPPGKKKEHERKKATPKPNPQKERKKDMPAQPALEPRPLPPAPASMDRAWTEVVSRKKKAKTGAPKPAAPRQASKRPEPKLRPPKSAAVVISLTPAAVEKGLTYAGVLTDAQRRVDLSGLQIDRLRPKYAATGAMLYEVPGADSEQKADSFAARLRECFGDSDVVVTRPTKCSELRISGLDFAATSESVKAALCSAGGCAAEAVKVGEVRPDRSGMGAVWAKAPTKAAQKIKAGRLKIGWVIARVTVLEARPMRCYRCLEQGHVRGGCAGSTDRSDLCYRCGKPGHKARQCADKLNCVLCAAAGKPAGHRIGGKIKREIKIASRSDSE
ncbi:serine/arginine repetitive matrix protein 1-like [Manduca sexta]|uniref:serine/arginine repetitive matrix protein 1-like n=1 Tax=Manduca sexta TaxID=7130 RepID=UPI00188E8AF1|nr:serine/arginine repetitive matrix protein 1-like [Manduca sexta]